MSRITLIIYAVSDLHLGEGMANPNPANAARKQTNRRAKTLISLWDAFCGFFVVLDEELNPLEDFAHDQVFSDFIDYILNQIPSFSPPPRGRSPLRRGEGPPYARKVKLKFLGDTFDFPAVLTEAGKSVTLPFESEDLYKMKRIIQGHPVFFDALQRFLEHPACSVDFFLGNHDAPLEWPSVKAELVNRIAPGHSQKVRFKHRELYNGICFEHGNCEAHTRFDQGQTILKTADLRELLKKENFEKLLKKGEIPDKEVLNVPYDHYLITDVQNHVRRYHALMVRMHDTAYIWTDAFFGFWRKSWYRKMRFWGLYMGYRFIRAAISHSFFAWWHVKQKGGFLKSFRVLWWTLGGIIEGATPRELAHRKLEEETIDAVVLGHEHEIRQETFRKGSRFKTYVNLGTWVTNYEVKKEPLECKWGWKYFGWAEKLLRALGRFLLRFFKDPDFLKIEHFPVLLINIDEKGESMLQLTRFDPESKNLKPLM